MICEPGQCGLRAITRRLDALVEQFRHVRSFSKEIDDLREEIKAIKKHLGLSAEIAA